MTFAQDRETVGAATIAVAAELGTITSAEKDAGLVVYKVGGFSSGGRTDVSVSLEAEGATTRVRVGATHGYQGVLGIGKSGKVQQQFLKALAARLANTTGASASAQQATSAPPVAATPLSGSSASVSVEDRGVFEIDSAPPGAEVYVDGEFVGTTPIAGHGLVTGKHEIELHKKGFAPWKRQLTVSAGARATVVAEMEPEGPTHPERSDSR